MGDRPRAPGCAPLLGRTSVPGASPGWLAAARTRAPEERAPRGTPRRARLQRAHVRAAPAPRRDVLRSTRPRPGGARTQAHCTRAPAGASGANRRARLRRAHVPVPGASPGWLAAARTRAPEERAPRPTAPVPQRDTHPGSPAARCRARLQRAHVPVPGASPGWLAAARTRAPEERAPRPTAPAPRRDALWYQP